MIIAQGIQRNTAAKMAKEVGKAGSYERLYFWFIIRKKKWPRFLAWADLPTTYAAADLAARLERKFRDKNSVDAMLYVRRGFQQISDSRLESLNRTWAGVEKTLQRVAERLIESLRKFNQTVIERGQVPKPENNNPIFKEGA